MKYLLIVSQLASEDLTNILGWYKTQEISGLDKRFIETISKILKRLEITPEMYPITHKNIRQALLTTFPYKIIYYIDSTKNEIHILAVIHQFRDFKVWKSRI